MKIVRVVLIVLVVAFLAIQLRRPDRSNPPEDHAQTLEAALSPPAEVSAVLARACADCHSSRTRWPWYTNIAPVSWWTAHHVEEGRHELSFSTFASYSAKKQAHKLEEVCEQVTEGEMPLGSYVLAHRDAKLSSADVKLLCDWTTEVRARLAASTASTASPAEPTAPPAAAAPATPR